MSCLVSQNKEFIFDPDITAEASNGLSKECHVHCVDF